MNTLTDMSVNHPYYCSDSNYYSNEPGGNWRTMDGFLNEFENSDIDMNLVFRWDICEIDDEPGQYRAEVFMIHQRKGIFAPHNIKSVTEKDLPRFHSYLAKHWSKLQEMWKPIS